jgi:hypothetical protein
MTEQEIAERRRATAIRVARHRHRKKLEKRLDLAVRADPQKTPARDA